MEKMEQRYNNKTITVEIFLKLKTGCNEVHVHHQMEFSFFLVCLDYFIKEIHMCFTGHNNTDF